MERQLREHDIGVLGGARPHRIDHHERVEGAQGRLGGGPAGRTQQRVVGVDDQRLDIAGDRTLDDAAVAAPALGRADAHVRKADHIRLGRQVVQVLGSLVAVRGDREVGGGASAVARLSRRGDIGREHDLERSILSGAGAHSRHRLRHRLGVDTGHLGRRARGIGDGGRERLDRCCLVARRRAQPGGGEWNQLAPARRNNDELRAGLERPRP